MAKTSFEPRSVWTDRFKEPTILDLQAELSEQDRCLLVEARAGFGILDGVCETVEWAGFPMRWSFVYRVNGQERALAYLVPDPSNPTLVLPLTFGDIEAILTKRIPKFVHQSIIHAAEVDRVRWVQWILTSSAQVKILTRLVPCTLAGTIA